MESIFVVCKQRVSPAEVPLRVLFKTSALLPFGFGAKESVARPAEPQETGFVIICGFPPTLGTRCSSEAFSTPYEGCKEQC